jgi:hypothetical protein
MANCYDSADQYEWQSNDGSGWVFASSSDAFDFTADVPFGPVAYRVRVTNAGVVSDWTVISLGLIQYQIYGTLIYEGCYGDPDYQCCSGYADGAGGEFGGCGGPNSYGTSPPYDWGISSENFLVDGAPNSSGAQLIWPPIPVTWYSGALWGGTADTRKYVLTGPSGDVDVAWTSTTYFMPLPAGTTSSVTIKAVSYGGETASGVTLSITTPPANTAPGSPTSLSGTAGNGQVSLSWAAPASNGGEAITDYAVQYSSNSGSTWATFSDGTSTDTSATVTGLTNGTAYTFRVAAVNSVGTGSYSSVSASVTPSITADYLVVAGGGAMHSFYHGAGGAGGLLTGTMSLTAGTAYSVAVGAGGANNGGGGYYNGANSQFASLTAIGGGRGGLFSNGFAGGSGGGGSEGGQPGQGTTGQGYSGGYGACAGGGGGGAGGAGIASSTYIDGDGDLACLPPAGGAGYTSSITGTATEYARGGTRITGGQNTTAMPGAGASVGSYAGRNGVVIIAYQGSPLTAISAGLTYTYSTTSRSGYNVYTFTGGSGTITP